MQKILVPMPTCISVHRGTVHWCFHVFFCINETLSLKSKFWWMPLIFSTTSVFISFFLPLFYFYSYFVLHISFISPYLLFLSFVSFLYSSFTVFLNPSLSYLWIWFSYLLPYFFLSLNLLSAWLCPIKFPTPYKSAEQSFSRPRCNSNLIIFDIWLTNKLLSNFPLISDA